MIPKTRACSSFLVVAISFLVLQGCAFTPKPVILFDKPHIGSSLPDNGLKVSVIVQDARSELKQAMRYCGDVKNSYGMTTSFVFIANPSKLSEIIALHTKRLLVESGYEVVHVFPEVSGKTFGEEKTKAPKVNKREVNDKAPGNFDDPRDADPDWASAADAVVFLKIRKCTTGFLQAFFFVEVHSGIGVDVQVEDLSKRTVVMKSLSGFGTSGPRQFISEESYNVSVNMAYWIALSRLKTLIQSPTFRSAVIESAEDAGRTIEFDEDKYLASLPEEFTLRVEVHPKKARVAIDGKSLGSGPIGEISLSKGSHTIKVDLKGFAPIKEELFIVSDDPIEFTLQKK